MAAKRFLDEQDSDLDQPVDQKRMRTRPSFASYVCISELISSSFLLVIGEAVMVNSLRNLCFSLEPMIRRVVNEEVESSLRRSTCSLTRSASLQIQALEASSLQLMYSKSLLLPIFTGSKIVDLDSSPLQILLVDTRGDQMILGPGMSEKMWEVTIKHARTCDLGNNHFIFHRPNCTITLNPICQIVHAMIEGNSYSNKELPSIRGYIETLVRQAYVEWNSLEEVAGFPSDSTHLLTQGEPVDQYLNQHQTTVKSFPPLAYSTDHNRYIETGNVPSNAYNNWKITSNHYHGAAVEQGIQYSISESSSDGEITSKLHNGGIVGEGRSLIDDEGRLVCFGVTITCWFGSDGEDDGCLGMKINWKWDARRMGGFRKGLIWWSRKMGEAGHGSRLKVGVLSAVDLGYNLEIGISIAGFWELKI
ncbi:hypothetical protein POTOM_049215 [Populus tomentosa]|uniref:Uncharacterized protein n=1 Tax=Populus tomentosa TaxID=118781 RepID=A0A8X8CBL8_POPTO|nr:hypothetical protein POTOM_049215 [Populus tomentosa]